MFLDNDVQKPEEPACLGVPSIESERFLNAPWPRWSHLPEPTTGQRKCLSPWPAMTPAGPETQATRTLNQIKALLARRRGCGSWGRRPEDQGLTQRGICKWDPQTHSITWKLIRNTNSPTSPHTSEIYICGSGPSNMVTGVPKQWNFFHVCTQVWELWPVPPTPPHYQDDSAKQKGEGNEHVSVKAIQAGRRELLAASKAVKRPGFYLERA